MSMGLNIYVKNENKTETLITFLLSTLRRPPTFQPHLMAHLKYLFIKQI